MNVPARIPTAPERLRLRVEDYLLLNDGGAFEAYTRTELIDGDIYVINAQYARHARIKSRLLVALAIRLAEIGSDLEAIGEVAVRLSGDSMPEPDIVLARYKEYGPVPVGSVALVIEVSDTTLDRDLGRKSQLYAAAGVQEYWVVDLEDKRVLMHEHPDADGYHWQLDVPLGKTLISATIEGLEVASARLLD